MRTLLSGLLIAVTLVAGTAAPAGAAQPFTPAEEKAVEEIVQDYLVENPEVIGKAIRALRDKREKARRAKAKEALAAHRDKLLNAHPVAGNPDGDVAVVEFFDYQCGYCKSAFPGVRKTVRRDGDVRWVLIDFPILGPVSRYAAKAALAAREQDKYFALHQALMEHEGKLSKDAVMAEAEAVGLDVEQLKQDMQADSIQRTIDSNLELAKALDVTGTPAFVVGDTVAPGAVKPKALKKMIARARENKQEQ